VRGIVLFPRHRVRCNVGAVGRDGGLCQDTSVDRWIVRVWVLGVSLATVACTSSDPGRAADNLLFVVFDTTRADRLSSYGYERVTSPAIDALAARGATFTRAHSHVPSTLPAHSSMFTGVLPPEHGVRCNGKFRLSDAHVTLAEALAGAGFVTGAVVGAFPLDSRFGIAQGFEHYDADFSASAVTAKRRRGRMDDPGFWIGHDFVDFERGADEVTDLSIAWLSGQSARWFLFAHYFDPHWPYEPPDEYAVMFESPYDAEIAYADYHLGRLLDFVSQLPGRTLVVFTADHGEGLGDHGEPLHNRYLYDSTLRVPLVVELGGAISGGTRIDATVGHVDLMPSVLELLGVAPPAGLTGVSLVPLLRGSPAARRPLYAETLVHALERPRGIEVRAWIEAPWKLVRTERIGAAPRVELYDLEADPGELIDLARSHAGTAEEIASRFDAEIDRLAERARGAESIAIDDATEARLKSLGYL
jgi:arylsulfatase A-like enzyme